MNDLELEVMIQRVTAANTIIKAFTYVFLGARITGSYFSFINKP
jgi:hypothetical protein